MPTLKARKSARSSRLNVRTTPHQARLIRAGAAKRGVSVTNFILESACQEAEHAIADQREFVVSEKQWKAFTEALDRPPEVKPGLAKLFAEMRDKKRGSGE